MTSENKDKATHYKLMATSFLEGTFSGIAVRFIAWPLEKVYYDFSDANNTKSYFELFRANTKPKTLYQLQTHCFKKAGFLQTFGKSFSNLGVISYVENTHPDYTPFQKAALITLISTPLDAIFTTSGEWNKVKYFTSENMQSVKPFNIFNIKNILTPDFGRAFGITFARGFWSSIFTYGGIYGTEALIRPYCPENTSNSTIKTLSAVVGAALAQPFIMPAVNLQTHIFKNTSEPTRLSIGTFFKKYPLKKIARGALGRMAHRSFSYGAGFFITEKLKEYKEKKQDESLDTPRRAKLSP